MVDLTDTEAHRAPGTDETSTRRQCVALGLETMMDEGHYYHHEHPVQ